MKFIVSVILGTLVAGSFIVWLNLPEWKTQTAEVVTMAETAEFDRTKWNTVFEKSDALPDVFPISAAKNIFHEIQNIFIELDKIGLTAPKVWRNDIKSGVIFDVFASLKAIDRSLEKIDTNLHRIPDFLLEEEQKREKKIAIEKIEFIRDKLKDARKLEKVFHKFVKNKERLLILLQNQNEPRSTGGFTGSVIIVDFSPKRISWRFSDIYALDRKVPIKKQTPAPEFFHGLSKTISLRDANFWPDFPTSAQKYRTFFAAIDEKMPTTVVGINLNLIREILKLTGPVHLQKWGIEMNDHNFDAALSFLVESKVSGRFAVKQPVLDFAKALFALKRWQNIPLEKILAFNFSEFIEGKNLLAFSKDSGLQKLFKKWKIAGEVKKDKEADNFLHFDFVSVGANKTEKFLWTKLWHDSEIHQNGRIINSLEITRNHLLRPGELQDLLKVKNWPPNIQALITDDLLWKLGAGQNRTVMRVYVPKDAKLMFQDNPSGEIKEILSDDENFKIFEVPLFVLPGERLKTYLKYETKLDRGSHDWRPYYLQVVGTPGRNQTSFLETISTDVEGRFKAETMTLGRPQKLIDNDFRAVLEFD